MKEYRVESCRPHRGWRVLAVYESRFDAEFDAAILRRRTQFKVTIRVTEHVKTLS